MQTLGANLRWMLWDTCRRYPTAANRAIFHAIQASLPGLLDLLAANGVSLGFELLADNDHSGSWPLEMAAERGDHVILEKLLELYGADAAVESYRYLPRWGGTSLNVAAHQGHLDALIVLASVPPPMSTASSSEVVYRAYIGDALEAAAKVAHIPIMHTLIDTFGADVNYISSRNTTPLYAAVDAHRAALPAVWLPLDAGADPNVHKHMCIPLHIAVEKRDVEVISLLLDAGANINARDLEGQSVLRCAMRRGVPYS